MRKQLGTKNSKSNEGRQANNGGVKGRDGSAEELDRETGEEQITVGCNVPHFSPLTMGNEVERFHLWLYDLCVSLLHVDMSAVMADGKSAGENYGKMKFVYLNVPHFSTKCWDIYTKIYTKLFNHFNQLVCCHQSCQFNLTL